MLVTDAGAEHSRGRACNTRMYGGIREEDAVTAEHEFIVLEKRRDQRIICGAEDQQLQAVVGRAGDGPAGTGRFPG